MKKVSYKVSLLALLASLVIPSTVMAMSGSDKVATIAENRQRTGTTLEDRLKADKAKLKVQLSEADKAKTKNKCKAAQNLVKAQATKAANFEASRKKVYDGVLDRLEKLAVKLEAAGNSDQAAKVRAEKIALSAKADAVYAALQDYKQVLDDLAGNDCTADPTAFKAALEASRAARDAVKSKTKDFRDYYTQTTVKILAEVKKALGTSTETKTEGAN